MRKLRTSHELPSWPPRGHQGEIAAAWAVPNGSMHLGGAPNLKAKLTRSCGRTFWWVGVSAKKTEWACPSLQQKSSLSSGRIKASNEASQKNQYIKPNTDRLENVGTCKRHPQPWQKSQGALHRTRDSPATAVRQRYLMVINNHLPSKSYHVDGAIQL